MLLPAADSFWDCVTFGILGKYINARTLKDSVVFKEETKEIRSRDFSLSVLLPLPLPLSHSPLYPPSFSG